jgi:spore germination protein YaaH
MKLITLNMLLLFFVLLPVTAQEHPSIHQQEWEYYRQHPDKAILTEASVEQQARFPKQSSSLTAAVYGFHPYWMNGMEGNYRYDLLSHLAYFSADVDPATGNFSSTHNYSTAGVITQAKNAGVKVHLTVVLFSNHAALWASQANQDKLVSNIVAKVKERDIHGVNIDFESMTASDAAPFRKFIKQLGDSLHAAKKELCVELFAVDWNSIFPSSFFSEVDQFVDSYFIMLYAYYYSGSSTAGPNAPLRTSSASGYHVLKSIDSYLTKGCPPAKLIAGFPYYGIDWPVSSSARMATATGSGSSRFYNIAKNNYLDTMKAGNIFFDATYATPWYRYQTPSGWRQTWYDDSLSLAMKYDSVKAKKIAGIGMWALGYDAAEPELWNLLRSKFTASNGIVTHAAAPSAFFLAQNYPNPFNPVTTLQFTVSDGASAQPVTLTVYDMLGRTVTQLVNGHRKSGLHTVQWNASDNTSGIYFAKLTAGTTTLIRKLTLLK